MIVEFSKPFRITQELVAKYKQNKREGTGEMLKTVESKMREVTLNAPSYKELQMIYLARDIYMPSKSKGYTINEINEIQKKFAKGFATYRSSPELKPLLEEVEAYMRELKALNVEDSGVKTLKINFCRIILNFVNIIPRVVINLLFSLAGLIMLFPLGMLNRHLAEKARKEALAGSAVKVVGADVMATKKLSTTLMLYPLLCFGFTTFFFYVLGMLHIHGWERVLGTVAFFFFFPLYSYICILSMDNLLKY